MAETEEGSTTNTQTLTSGRYIVDSQTQNIHDSYTLREVCNTDDMAEGNRREVGVKEFVMLVREGFNLCQHCFGERR